jgi:glycosyltransferase involved in cell wall biosynthesis
MRILILNTHVPFIGGGAETHADSLQGALRKAGHDAEIVRIPFKWYPPEKIHDHLLSCRLLDLTEANGNKIDMVIGLKFPAYHIPHPNKRIWILHQFRTAFEMWGSEHCDLSPTPQGRSIRDSIERIEKRLLTEAKHLFANSKTVAKRLWDHCQIPAEPLYHPPQNAEQFRCQDYGDYLYFPSRLNKWKRQELALEALAKTRQPVQIRFSGLPDNPEYLRRLQSQVRKLGLQKRVVFLGRLSFEEILDQYAKARAILFIPSEEDYGYVTLEAMLSSKAVITCSDSGGPIEFIQNEKEGYVTEPKAEELATAMDLFWKNPSTAKELGQNALNRYREVNISWEHVVSSLLK